MNIENTAIKSIAKSYDLSALQNIESDFILPDYFADISKILKCTVIPFVEAVSVSGDKISVAGKVHFSLLYTAEDNQIYNFENEIKYTKVFQGQNVDISDSVMASQYITAVNYRALGPKRIEIKGGIQISVNVTSVKDLNIISSVQCDDTYMKTMKSKILMPVIVTQRDFSVNEISAPENVTRSQIQCFVRKECKVNINEIKPISNKLFLKGSCEVSIYYITDTARINSTVVSIPFSEVVDVYLLEETDVCEIRDILSCVNVIIKDDGNDKCSFDVSVNVSFTVNAAREKEISFIKDIYSSSSKIFAEYKEVDMCLREENIGKTFSSDFEAEVYDEKGEIIDCFVDGVRITQEIKDEKLCAVISGNYNALVRKSDGGYYLVSRMFANDYELETGHGGSQNIVKVIDFNVLGASALHLGDDKIKFKSDIYVKYKIVESCKENILSSCNADILESDSIKNRMILYYGRKNEEIWDIAKENNASITQMKMINNIEGDILAEDQMLLLTNF